MKCIVAALFVIQCHSSSARLMNVSVEAMSATRKRINHGPHSNRSIIASSYCKTPSDFVGRVLPGDGFFKPLLASDRIGFVPGILENASDTIAITGVQSCCCNGLLQYNNATTDIWSTISDLRPDSALVLGRGNSLRCVVDAF